MFAVYKREIKAYVNNVYGFLFAAVLLLVLGVMVFLYNLNAALADISFALVQGGYSEFVLMLMIPVLCMRIMAEDKHRKTDLLYLSLPLRTGAVVMGKYLALLTVFTAPMLIVSLYPIVLHWFGDVNFASSYATIFTYYLLGAALLAMCMFLSSLTNHVAVAGVLGVAACVVLYFLPLLVELLPYTPVVSLIGLGILSILLIVISWFSSRRLTVTAVTAAATVLPLGVLFVLDSFVFKWGAFEGLLPTVISYASPFRQFETTATSSTFDLFGVSIILSFAAFFVFLTVQSADKRRWA